MKYPTLWNIKGTLPLFRVLEYEVENKAFGAILAIGRYIMMICLYIGAGY